MVDDTTTPAEVLAKAAPLPDPCFCPPRRSPTRRAWWCAKKVVVDGADLVGASQGFRQDTGQPIVNITFNGRGGAAFGDTTLHNVNHRFAIILDGKVISAPNINQAILGGQCYIEGNFTQESANDLALLLRSGALPAPIHVGGAPQRLRRARRGCGEVRRHIARHRGDGDRVVFIVLAYGLFGLFAAAALIVNVLLLIAIMSLTQGTLTLPGVAGLIPNPRRGGGRQRLDLRADAGRSAGRAHAAPGGRPGLSARPRLHLRRQRHDGDLRPDHVPVRHRPGERGSR